MNKLVIDHTYGVGMAWDKTSNRNHGILHMVQPGAGDFTGAMSLAPGRTHPGSAIIVPTSPSLQDIGTLRVRCRVYPTVHFPIDPGFNPNALQLRRQNIVEAHRSFAFYLTSEFELKGTILDPNNQWIGIVTRSAILPPNRWSLIEFWYDGISAAELLVNGQRVASAYDPAQMVNAPMRGPVRSVGSNGIFIGHWPHPDDSYTFSGYIRDVQIWKRDDHQELDSLRDPCCPDGLQSLYDRGGALHKQGHDAQFWRKRKEHFIAVGTEVSASLRGSSEESTLTYNRVVRDFLDALAHGNDQQLEIKMRAALEYLKDRVEPAQVDAVRAKVEELLGELPFSRDELLEMGKELCVKPVDAPARRIARNISDDDSWASTRNKFNWS